MPSSSHTRAIEMHQQTEQITPGYGAKQKPPSDVKSGNPDLDLEASQTNQSVGQRIGSPIPREETKRGLKTRHAQMCVY